MLSYRRLIRADPGYRQGQAQKENSRSMEKRSFIFEAILSQGRWNVKRELDLLSSESLTSLGLLASPREGRRYCPTRTISTGPRR